MFNKPCFLINEECKNKKSTYCLNVVLTYQLLKLKTQEQIHVLFGYFLGINIFMTPFVDDLKDPQCIFFQPEVKKVFLV